MSKDIIHREDAIKAIAETIADDGDTSAWLYVAEDMLKDVPFADRPQGWIPCSERLPKEDGCYLVTLAFEWGNEMEVGELFGGKWVNPNSHVTVAWMPLPAPWKGADNE